jgi:glutamine synthetase
VIDAADATTRSVRLRDEGVRLVGMTFVDNGGITRIKIVPLARLERTAIAGVGMSDVWAVSANDDHFAFDYMPQFDSPSGDMRLVPDLTAVRALAAAPGWAWAPANQYSQELQLLETCQRGALRRATDAAAAVGIEFKATFEVECTLLDGDLRPAHDGPGYSTRALLAIEPFVLQLAEVLEAQGIDVDQLHPEYSPGQFEVSVGATDPVDAADRLVLMRTTIRQVAAQHGFQVSYAPIVIPGAVGNGCHLHLSAWRGGENLMTGGPGPGGLRAEGASFVAGMLEALPAITAVAAPSAASYLRLQPGHWSGAYTVWGVENREATLRLIPGSRSVRGQAANVELKTVDGAANPYLAVLASIGAGLDGISRGLPLADGVTADPAKLSDAERERAGIRRLPASLSEAADALAESAVLRAAFGDLLFDSFLAVRRYEAALYADADADQLAEAHRWAY